MPSLRKDKEKFQKAILRIVTRLPIELVIPVNEETCLALAECKEELEEYCFVAVPELEILLKSVDKGLSIRIAEEIGVPCPKTFFLEDVDDIKEVSEEVSYPAVIKPRRKVIWVGKGFITMKVNPENYVRSPSELVRKYRALVARYPFLSPDLLPLVQEFVPGQGYGAEFLLSYRDGTLKAVFAHKRLREYPITGGVSTLRIGIKAPSLLELGLKLLRAMNWRGVAMVEFKVGPDGVPRLMEVNGRFWGSLPLAIASGVDFPFLLYLDIMGHDFKPVLNYRAGVMRRWLIPADVLWLLDSIASGCGLNCLLEFLRSFSVPDDVLSFEDIPGSMGILFMALKYMLDVMKGRRSLSGEILPKLSPTPQLAQLSSQT
ncbi:MAG: hypothetical protein DRJ69_04945 [Thermoprotei archaeon]|nr:MAG: hypothetical protein DRJ69_04945 [Thermoprotei archaeon]